MKPPSCIESIWQHEWKTERPLRCLLTKTTWCTIMKLQRYWNHSFYLVNAINNIFQQRARWAWVADQRLRKTAQILFKCRQDVCVCHLETYESSNSMVTVTLCRLPSSCIIESRKCDKRSLRLGFLTPTSFRLDMGGLVAKYSIKLDWFAFTMMQRSF